MKRLLVVLAATLLLPITPGVSAAHSHVCWTETRTDMWGKQTKRMVCRVGGKIIEEGTPGWTPPEGPLVYDLGYDLNGECYYQRHGDWGGWVVLGSSGDSILFGYDPDGIPGGPVAGDVWVEPCTTEPIPGTPPLVRVWEIVTGYEFANPDPEIVPEGIGLAGAATHVYVEPPEPFSVTVRSAITNDRLDVEIRAVAVKITWGDGAVTTIPESLFELFAPHPDGEVNHVWETSEVVDMTVEYEWSVRWRRNLGAWRTLVIDDTTWSDVYRVDEIVGRRSG